TQWSGPFRVMSHKRRFPWRAAPPQGVSAAPPTVRNTLACTNDGVNRIRAEIPYLQSQAATGGTPAWRAPADGRSGQSCAGREAAWAAPVTRVEYGDCECPCCGAAHPMVKAIQAIERRRFNLMHGSASVQ